MFCDENNCSLFNLIIEGEIWKKKKLLYKFPCKSKVLKTWQLSLESHGIAKYPLTDVSYKLLRLQFPLDFQKKNVFFVMPLLHLQT